jgi:uncharacterized membrane protein YdfJ with MMPL/SSD domain
VLAAFADLALRRPWALLAANLVVLGIAMALAVGAPGRLGIGSLALDEPVGDGRAEDGAPPDLVIVTTGRTPVRSGVYRVALRVIAAGVRSDPGVAAVRRGPISANERSTSLNVFLSSDDDRERLRDVERIEAGVDPGPLHVAFGGEVAAPLEARRNLSGDFWRLELLALPFVVLVLVAALGPRLAVAPALSAATAIAGSLAGLRIAGAFVNVSLLGIAPAAVLGLAIGVEAPCLLVARFRDEADSTPRSVAVHRTLAAAAALAFPLGIGATAAIAGVVATGLDQAGSMLLACGLSVGLALASALVCVPALIGLWGPSAMDAADEPYAAPPLRRVPRALAGFLASSRLRTVLAGLACAAAMLGAASPLMHADSRPFSPADLRVSGDARMVVAGTTAGRAPGRAASATAVEPPSPSRQSLFGKLAVAAGISAAAFAIVLLVAFRSLRVLPVAIFSLLPAAAACGLCVLVFQDGHIATALGQRGQGALETGAVASLLAGLVAVSAARGVAALRAARGERGLGLGPARAAEMAATLTVPAAIVATLIGAAATAVLAGSDLYPAREFGLAVATGLLIDLFLLRVPLLTALARWGGED